MYAHHNFEMNVLKPVEKFEDFFYLYKTFCYPPYSEDWTEEKVKIVFSELKENGKIIGLYFWGKCIGIVALDKKRKVINNLDEHIYLSDLIVLNEFKTVESINMLLKAAIAYCKEENYKIIFLRTLQDEKSREVKAFKEVGFVKMWDKCDVVNFPRTRKMKEEDCRIFWKYVIN